MIEPYPVKDYFIDNQNVTVVKEVEEGKDEERKIKMHVVGVQGTYCFDIKADLNYNGKDVIIGKKVCDGAAKHLPIFGSTPYP